MWRVLYVDKWTGESACMYRNNEFAEYYGESVRPSASARLWSPFVRRGHVQCVRFRYRVHDESRLVVLKHNKG